MSSLFSAYDLKGVTLRNRIAASPMCQYMAKDGMANDWHAHHYNALARGGAGLVVVEATAVAPEGRITPADLGLWTDAQADALAPIVQSIKKMGAIPGIQIAHAGRKASANRPWEGDDHIESHDPRSWETIAPSAIPYGENLPKVPRAMTQDDIVRVQKDFATAVQRAHQAGFEWLLLHFAHGYLAQSFFSLHSNQRQDEYGGSAENRGRFLMETLTAVKKVWPENLPLTARFGVIEFDGRDEATLAESIDLIKRFKTAGLDLLDVSVNFSTPTAKIPWGPNFMGDIAARVRREVGIPVATSWYISDPQQANALIEEEKVDLVMIGRPLLANPHWPYKAALDLGIEKAAWATLPAPYAHWLAKYRPDWRGR